MLNTQKANKITGVRCACLVKINISQVGAVLADHLNDNAPTVLERTHNTALGVLSQKQLAFGCLELCGVKGFYNATSQHSLVTAPLLNNKLIYDNCSTSQGTAQKMLIQIIND